MRHSGRDRAACCDALNAIAEGARIGEQRHPGFVGRAVAFALVAHSACGAEVFRPGAPAARTRQNVIERQIEGRAARAAVLAAITVARQNGSTLRDAAASPAHVNVLDQAND